MLVFALKDPEPDLLLLDRLLLVSREKDLPAAVIFNKIDVVAEATAKKYFQVYQKAGYETILCSAKLGVGLEEVRQILKNKISVFTGPSGAGKSSLLNAINPGLALKTGAVSIKIGRGKHTTRHVELLPLDFGGWVADTPGFSVLETPVIPREEFDSFYPEIAAYGGLCRFTSCLHHREPNCAVKEAVEAGEIDRDRYQRYLHLLQEVIEQERRH